MLIAVSRRTVRLVRNRLGRHRFGPARRDVDRPALGRRGSAAGSPAAELFADLPVALLERTVAESTTSRLGADPDRVRLDVDGTLHAMTALRRRLVARRRRRRGRTRATASSSTTTRRCCPIRARRANPTACTTARSCGDPIRDAWTDGDWAGRSIEGAVIYELHVGTFTPGGTFDSAIEKLDYLVDLGVDFVELMPVNAFSGTHGWGYDGVLWYAVHEPYGGPDGSGAVRRRLPPPRPRRADRRGVQPPRPVGQLSAAVRPLPVVGQQSVGRVDQHRRRRTPTRCGATSSTARCAGCATSTPTVCASTRCTPWSTPPPSTSSRNSSAETDALAARIGPSAVADRRERPQRSAADHPARPRRLGMTAQWDDDIHHAIHTAVSGERQGYYARFRLAGDAGADAEARLLPRGHVLVVPAPSARPAAGHRDDPGDPAAGLHR